MLFEKKNLLENGRIFDKNHGLTPLQKVDFFYVARTSLFRSKKHSLLSRIYKKCFFLAFFAQNNILGKRPFFKKNHGLTRLQNVDLLKFFRTSLLWSKSILLYPEYQKMFLSGFFLLKKNV